MKKQSLAASTLLLTVSSVLVRTIGMISTVFLSQILGDEGIGIYELLMSVYMTAVIFASAGLSASVSRMAAESLGKNKGADMKKIMTTSFSYALISGFIVMTVLFVCAPLLSTFLIHCAYVKRALRILALGIPFTACSSCFKGYFYARQKTIYPASSDTLEQLVKLGLIVGFVRLFAPSGLMYTYQATAMGLALGEFISWSFLLSLFLMESKKQLESASYKPSDFSLFQAFGQFMSILLPIASVSYIGYIFLSMENILIPMGLKKFGQSFSASMSLYGTLKGMVLPVLFFPSAFLTAFSITLIPEISKSRVLRQHNRVADISKQVIRLTLVLGILVVAVFLSYCNELGFVLYHSETVGPMLRLLTVIVPFSYMEVVSDGILKGLNEQLSCLRYSLIDSICRIALLYFLLPVKGFYAFFAIIITSSIFTAMLNFNKLLSVTGLKFQLFDWLIKPGIAAVFASCYSRLIINRFFGYSLGLTTKVFLGILLIIMLYILALSLLYMPYGSSFFYSYRSKHKAASDSAL